MSLSEARREGAPHPAADPPLPGRYGGGIATLSPHGRPATQRLRWSVAAMITVRCGAATDVGTVRQLNEDSLYVGRSIWMIADGMGGHAAGDVASRLTVRNFADLDGEQRALHPGDLVETTIRASEQILSYGRQNRESWGLGTTVTGIALVSVGGADHWAIFNVGDSRVYHWLDGKLSRATVDHSRIEELLLAGSVTEDEARHHSSRNIVTRSLGSIPAPQVDLWILPPTTGERFVLCSDGLNGEIEDGAIASLTQQIADPQQLAEALVATAVENGGRDNVSVVVVDLLAGADDDDDEPTSPRELVHEGQRR